MMRPRPRWRLAASLLAAFAGLATLVAYAAHARFKARVSREVRDMWADAPAARPIDRAAVARLPEPVRRYIEQALGPRTHSVRTVRLRHGGTFRTSLDGAWGPIRGEQYFKADSPGFIWWGRIQMAPGLWVDARDRSVGGVGNMYVAAESLVPIADSSGPELDQGALLRLLGEMTWFPTAFLDDRYVTWTPIDDTQAGARLRVGECEVNAVFEFGADGWPTRFTGSRYRDMGGAPAELTPFAGWSRNFRDVGGLVVPHTMVAAWQVNGEWKAYGRFAVEQLEFDATAPF